MVTSAVCGKFVTPAYLCRVISDSGRCQERTAAEFKRYESV